MNYNTKISPYFSMGYNFKCHKNTFYRLAIHPPVWKSKNISGQMVLSHLPWPLFFINWHKSAPNAKFQGIWIYGTCRKISLNFIRKLGIRPSNWKGFFKNCVFILKWHSSQVLPVLDIWILCLPRKRIDKCWFFFTHECKLRLDYYM